MGALPVFTERIMSDKTPADKNEEVEVAKLKKGTSAPETRDAEKAPEANAPNVPNAMGL